MSQLLLRGVAQQPHNKKKRPEKSESRKTIDFADETVIQKTIPASNAGFSDYKKESRKTIDFADETVMQTSAVRRLLPFTISFCVVSAGADSQRVPQGRGSAR